MRQHNRGRDGGKAMLPLLAGLLGLGAAVALIAGYLWWPRSPGPATPGVAEPVRIATNTAYAGTCPILAARDQGFFTAEGITPVILSRSSGKASLEAVKHGEADIGTVADVPVMLAGLNREPVSVIATFFKGDKDHGIVARRDRGIVSVADLKGKRIGVTLNTSGHFALDALLNRASLAPEEVTMRNYKPEQLADALTRGEVDAIVTWEPFLSAAHQGLGNQAAIFYGQDVYTSLYNLAGMRDYLTRHPQTVERVLRAVDKGARFCTEQPDVARALVARESKGNPAALVAAWPTYRFGVVLDQGLILALEDEAQWAIKNRLTTAREVPNYLDHLYLAGLEAVLPSAVTVIH